MIRWIYANEVINTMHEAAILAAAAAAVLASVILWSVDGLVADVAAQTKRFSISSSISSLSEPVTNSQTAHHVEDVRSHHICVDN